jgi:hypothetical protein
MTLIIDHAAQLTGSHVALLANASARAKNYLDAIPLAVLD